MERMTVVGIKRVNFTPDGQSNPIVGCSMYVNHPGDDMLGLVAEKLFVNVTSPAYNDVISLAVPCEVEVDFNRRGKVESIKVMDAAPDKDKK